MKLPRCRTVLALASCALLVIGGCTPQPAEPDETREAPVNPDKDGRPADMEPVPPAKQRSGDSDAALYDEEETQPVEQTREERGAHVLYYGLDDVQIAVVPGPPAGDPALLDTLIQDLSEEFFELGMRVRNVAGQQLDAVDKESITDFAAAVDADLVVCVWGDAELRDKFGSMLSYRGTVRATAYESLGDTVTTKEVRKIGQRSPEADQAARSAIEQAVAEVGDYMGEQLIRKIGQNLSSRRITLSGVDNYAMLTQIEAHLKSQDAINDVRRIDWNQSTGVAHLVVALQPDAIDNLPTYLATTPGQAFDIQQLDRTTIDAMRRGSDRN
jgi:hypothetical protein